MSEQAWEKEPWEAVGDGIWRRDSTRFVGPIKGANAERIVACVNALAGLKPEGVAEVVVQLRAIMLVGDAESRICAQLALEALGVSE